MLTVGTKVPGSESSTSLLLPGTRVPSVVLSFPGAKVRGNESSIIRVVMQVSEGSTNC